MYLMNYLVYELRPYGLVEERPATPEPPPDSDLSAEPWTYFGNETEEANKLLEEGMLLRFDHDYEYNDDNPDEEESDTETPTQSEDDSENEMPPESISEKILNGS